MTVASIFCSFRNVLIISIIIRVVLILYSEWHDARSIVKYTDVDYRVFTDAAQFLLHPGPGEQNKAQGPLGYVFNVGDPYSRETYRYTPLLALVVSPNDWLHPSFGKYLFAACDVFNGILLYNLLVSSVLPKTQNAAKTATLYAALHLLNPMVFSISTRGSSESVLCLFVLLTLYGALKNHWDVAAVMLGISVHWKIYPAIYGFACISTLAGPRLKYLSWRTIRFGVLSVSTFALLNGICYLIWGYPFLYESYLYHLHRLDHRHNFSPYFYLTYLTYPTLNHDASQLASLSTWNRVLQSPLTSFVPQMTLAIGTGLLFGQSKTHLPFAWFVQTVLFVVFNKVCTSQYFLWYLLLLPLILPRSSLSRTNAVACVAVWVAVQALWLSEAYRLEFLGSDVFYGLWIRGLVYVVGNCWVVAQLMQGYDRKYAEAKQ